ncbi:RES family NAD+ phosphorylase [Vibrio agarivorans]|uniref:RES family NAD+ phosphorylase n=1 Tax=Vibrio agarivorans TaxID=153622 RepID=A0ABT7XZA2_9VIBR|nr:RES family NAD+ phosphorylase [Vibrio agarivorans]MDN2481117.1 RES family NAD+ phosphorylase [Vibrio agarivorans]
MEKNAQKYILELEYIHELAKLVLQSSCPEEVKRGLSQIVKFYDTTNFQLSFSMPYFRARKCTSSTGYASTSDIYIPPPKYTDAGRLNEAGKPVLYLCLSMATALSEIKATDGDYVQIGLYEPKDKKLRLGLIGEKIGSIKQSGAYLPIEKSEHYRKLIDNLNAKDPKLAMAYLYSDGFLNEVLTDPSADSKNYLHSRALTNLIINKEPFLDGIMYHSLAHSGGMNIALPFESAQKNIGLGSTFVIKVNKKYKYGLFDYEVVSKGNVCSKSNSVTWEKTNEY